MSVRSSSSGFKLNEAVLLRIGLLCAGGWLVVAALRGGASGLLPESRGLVFLMIAAGAGGLALILAAGLRRSLWTLRWLILVSLVAEVVISAVVWVKNSPRPAYVRIDSGLYLEMAADIARHGDNPYDWDFSAVYDVYRTDRASLTSTLDGSTAGRYPYPALSFLLAIPFQMVGLPGAFLLVLTAEILALVVLFLGAPRALQPLILFPLVVGTNFTTIALLGGIDIVWALLLTCMVLAWRKPYARAVFYGLAAAYKQNVWLLAPFLLVRLWKDYAPRSRSSLESKPLAAVREIGRFVLVSAGIFLMANLPFMVRGLGVWYKGIMSPLQSNLVLLSQGSPSGLVQFGYLSLPRSYFSLVTLVVWGLLTFVYWRHYDDLCDAGLLAPALVMWFSPRTLIGYWVYWTFPALALLCHQPDDTPPSEHVSWKPTLQVAGLTGGMLVVAGVLLARPSPVSMEVIPPYMTVDGAVMRLTVQVTNNSSHLLVPRFMVQHRDTAGNPLPWFIESGPGSLASGESGLFRISSNGQPGFVAHDPGQIVLTDAGGDQALRAVATIGPDQTFLWPDAIPNPDFLYWDAFASEPIFWNLHVDPFGAGSISLTRQQDRRALALALDNSFGLGSRVALTTAVPFPREPFSVWVYLDRASGVQRGVDIIDGEHRLTFLFGANDRAGADGPRHYVIERAIPVDKWSRETIDLQAAYAQAGWKPPSFEYVTYRGVAADFRLITLALFVSSDDASATGHIWFSSIEQNSYRLKPADLMAETLSDPAGYYVRLGRLYEQERNYDLALAAYRRARSYAPDDSAIGDLVTAAEQRIEEASSVGR